jgi:hypothetical protein
LPNYSPCKGLRFWPRPRRSNRRRARRRRDAACGLPLRRAAQRSFDLVLIRPAKLSALKSSGPCFFENISGLSAAFWFGRTRSTTTIPNFVIAGSSAGFKLFIAVGKFDYVTSVPLNHQHPTVTYISYNIWIIVMLA